MKLIWITAECPYPANTGGRIGVWQRIIQLSKNNDIFLYTIIDDERERESETELLKFCRDVHFFPRNSKTPLFFLKCLFVPFPAANRWNKDMKREIDSRCENEKVDFIIVDFPQMAGVLSENVRKKQRIILNQHNIEHLVLKSLAVSFHHPIKRMIYSFVAAQMSRYEKRLYNKDFISLYTFVSSSDLDYFSKTYKKSNTYLMPVGANIEELPVENKSKDIVFIGKMSYPPNIEGVMWFLTHCWNRIMENVSDAHFYIVGKKPTEELVSACAEIPGVIVTGTVPSVEDYYKKASVVIIPLLNGGGVKVKLLEALGYGKLVVSTSKGVEGTIFNNKEYLVVEDDPDQFAEYCIEILNDPEKYEAIRKAALQKMREDYSWEGIVSSFEKYLRNELGGNKA